MFSGTYKKLYKLATTNGDAEKFTNKICDSRHVILMYTTIYMNMCMCSNWHRVLVPGVLLCRTIICDLMHSYLTKFPPAHKQVFRTIITNILKATHKILGQMLYNSFINMLIIDYVLGRTSE
jgi:hypothetical protein